MNQSKRVVRTTKNNNSDNCDVITTPPTVKVDGINIVDTQYLIKLCEKELLNNFSHMQIQSLSSIDLLSQFQSIIAPFKHKIEEYLVKLLEDLIVLIYNFSNADSYHGYLMAVVCFAKLRTDKSLVNTAMDSGIVQYFLNLFKDDDDRELQSGDFESVKGFLKNYEAFRDSALLKKIYKLCSHAMSSTIFSHLGLKTCSEKLEKLQVFIAAQNIWRGTDFISVILETGVFIVERGILFMQTGDWSNFVHSDVNYINWNKSVQQLKVQSAQLNDPSFFGFTESSYIADLENAIEIGKNIKKFSHKLSDFEKKMVTQSLTDLQFKHCEILTTRRARETRKAPFSILIDGDSSVGKSTITNMLFYHFGKLYNLPIGDEFKYSKNPVAKFWDGFRTSMWCLQLDDVSFMHPNKASDGDPSVMEVIQVVNNVPYVPDQAALENKGKTPLRCEFCIATTNTDHLNAYAYFSCPLAVRRRLPWVIRVIVKPQYATNEGMLDSTKADCPGDEYPDYWIWIIQRVKPFGETERKTNAVLEEVARYDNVYDFLRWFNATTKDFRDTQDKVLNNQRDFKALALCEHGLPKNKCGCDAELQASESGEAVWRPPTEREMYDEATVAHRRRSHSLSAGQINIFNLREERRRRQRILDERPWYVKFYDDITANIYLRLVYLLMWVYFQYPLTFILIQLCLRIGARWFPVLGFIQTYLTMRLFYNDRFWRAMATRVRFDGVRKKVAVATLAALVTLTGAYMMYSTQRRKLKLKKHNIQGNLLSKEIGDRPKPDEQPKINPWVRSDYELTSIDINPTISSTKGLGFEWLINKVERNVVHFAFLYTDLDVKKVKTTTACGLRGFQYLFNTHSLPSHLMHSDMLCDLMVTFKKPSELLETSITIPIVKSMIKSITDTDLSIITIKDLPPCADITKYLPSASLRGIHIGSLITRKRDGNIFKRRMDNIRYHEDAVTPMDFTVNLWVGYADVPTEKGDCGSVLVLDTEVGPILSGIHMLGSSSGEACSIALDNQLLNYLDNDVSAGVPVLSAPSAQRQIGDLNRKSPVRYLQDGQAIVYGSFEGFRGKHKSSVSKSLICPIMLKHGYQIKHGAPVMNGWEPWRIALEAMTKRDYQFNPDIVEKCKSSYLSDVLSKLDTKELEKIEVYDNCTAINGAPGIAYVDKLNRNTSAGNPWKKSKKYLMHKMNDALSESDDDDKYLMSVDFVKFDSEVMDRVDDCISKYINGERYCPVFCAHLKDEATSFKKIQAMKTRVFTGAPLDWTIVVRKYLLSVIRVMQRNKFAFECAPGTVAQSLEWTQIYNYLTQFGEDSIIAGDYASFDKSMLARLILAAFEIIEELCRMAGYSEEDLKVVRGIGVDTAYAWVDFDGDLIQFFGSNPSGHPLTVIINCIVNSLYMRYAYYELNPQHELISFKSNVALFTYGDDNIAGVDRLNAPWFNHTAISEVFTRLGLGYTMADKEAESVPFINISEATFLKRSWRWDPDVKAYLCPLDHDSINKMLTVWVRSKTICAEAQSIAVISSACREYFFYGKDIFEAKRKMFGDVIEEVNLRSYQDESTLPTWESLNTSFHEYVVDVNAF